MYVNVLIVFFYYRHFKTATMRTKIVKSMQVIILMCTFLSGPKEHSLLQNVHYIF